MNWFIYIITVFDCFVNTNQKKEKLWQVIGVTEM